jgi:hypothetical protein
MYLVDSQTRRAWPPYWANHKLRAIRAEVTSELHARDPNSTEVGDVSGTSACAIEITCSEREIRRETERRWADFCRRPRDLAAYRIEVQRQESH